MEMSTMSIDIASGYQIRDDVGARVPRIKILVQPLKKFRFRYKSEMLWIYGSPLGAENDSRQKKEAPTVELINFPGNAVIRCSLVTSEVENRMPHAHHLVKSEGNEEIHDFHEVKVSEEIGHVAAFHGMFIIRTVKKNVKDELVRKKKKVALETLIQGNKNVRMLGIRDLTKINQEAEEAAKTMNLDSAALCFQAFYKDPNGVPQDLTDPVYSHPINNQKPLLLMELCRRVIRGRIAKHLINGRMVQLGLPNAMMCYLLCDDRCPSPL